MGHKHTYIITDQQTFGMPVGYPENPFKCVFCS